MALPRGYIITNYDSRVAVVARRNIVPEVKGEPVDVFSAIGGALVTEAKGDVIEESVASPR